MANQDFYNTALTSLTKQIAGFKASNDNVSENSLDTNEHAKYLVEDDVPKIESGVKSYLSLVAARSATVREIDVVEVSSLKVMGETNETAKCIFLENANRSSLVCARALLNGINTTLLPSSLTAVHNSKSSVEEELQHNVVQVIWNGLINVSASPNEKKRLRPSKILGREALIVAYPFVKERFRRGIENVKSATKSERKEGDYDSEAVSKQSPIHTDELQSLSIETLQPMLPPTNIDIPMGSLLYRIW
jgi:hypothetical protein